MKRLIFTQVFSIFFITCLAQVQSTPFTINTDSVQNIAKMGNTIGLYIDSLNIATPANILQQQFVPFSQFEEKYIPQRFIKYSFYLRFSLINNSDTARTYFLYPGKLMRQFNLYSTEAQEMKKLRSNGVKSGFIELIIAPNTNNLYILEFRFFKTNGNNIEPTLIHPSHLISFKNKMFNNVTPKRTIGILLSGMLLMMIIVTLLNFAITKKIEFLYNSAYSFCMFLLIFFTSFLAFKPEWFKGFFISYFDMFLLMVSIIFYIQFTRYFLETEKKSRRLDKFFKIEIAIIILLLIIHGTLYFFTDFFTAQILLEIFIKTIVLVAGIFYIFLAFFQKNKLTNYLALGVAIQLFFYIISLVLGVINDKADSILTSPFFYFQIGVIISVLFFLIGLFYKNRQELIVNIQKQEALKIEAQKQRFEHNLSIYKAQQEERNRISADMHDELGAGMTSIRLFSELAKAKMGNNVTPEIEKISSSSNELINKMNAIIWSMSSENDSLANMIGYIRSYSKEYLENTGIEQNILIPDNIPNLQVPGVIRRNVFLTIKEALQNVVKHSDATKVNIELQYNQDTLRLHIHDNGKGIDFNNLRPYSNGLTNMKKRMQAIGVFFSIENKNGTLITLIRKIG